MGGNQYLYTAPAGTLCNGIGIGDWGQSQASRMSANDLKTEASLPILSKDRGSMGKHKAWMP